MGKTPDSGQIYTCPCGGSVAPQPPRPARFLDAWESLKRAHGGQRGATRALLDLGVPKEAVQHIKAVDEALRKVSLLISADTRQRHSAIVKAVALGIPLDAVGQPAGITRERVRQIWKNSGRTDKPWKDSRDG